MTAADKILQKALIASNIPSSEWTSIQAALRDRAFFSSKIEETRYIYEARRVIAEMLNEAQTSRGTIATREDAIRTIQKIGLSIYGEGKGGLTDPTSRERAAVIVDTNAGLAAGYVRHTEDMTLGARLLYPCQELVRAPASNPKMPRNWKARWEKAGGKLYKGRMVALVEDAIWSKLSRFGSPYPPFDYNSGMITVQVSRADAETLGVIKADYKPTKNPVQPGFNDSLTASVPYRGNSPEYKKLTDFFGDQITHKDGVIQWRPHMVSEAFSNNEPFKINLGKPTEKLNGMLSLEQREMLKEKKLTITDSWLREKDRHGYDHFEGEEHRDYNIPLNPGDLDMLPSMWHNPDRVIKSKNNPNVILLEIDTLDGGVLTAVVNIKNVPTLKTYYKRRK